MARSLILIAALTFTLLLGGLTAVTAARHGVDILVVVSGIVLALFAVGILGVVAPQAGVNSEVLSPRGGWFSPVSGRRWPSPCQ